MSVPSSAPRPPVPGGSDTALMAPADGNLTDASPDSSLSGLSLGERSPEPPEVRRPELRLTDAALLQARIHQDTHPSTRNKALRVWIADKNCDGLIFGVAFDYPIDGDVQYRFGGLLVLVDRDTARYIQGAEVDFVDDARGRGFVVQVPAPEQYRGKFFLKAP